MFIARLNQPLTGEILLPASKSISHRYLMMCALSDHQKTLNGLSESSDTRILELALFHPTEVIDFKDAGTLLRFYLTYASLKGLSYVIDGNERLKQRPIAELLWALHSLGARFDFLEKKDRLPLRVVNKVDLNLEEVTIDAGLSSQFVSALLLIAPSFKNGLKVMIKGDQVSKPYTGMTLNLMKQSGVEVHENPDSYQVSHGQYSLPESIHIEADWSAAAFIYAFAALLPNTNILLPGLYLNSAQGDREVVEIFNLFGIETISEVSGVRIMSKTLKKPLLLKLDFTGIPDAFPAISALCAATRTEAEFTGVKNLRLKESDRVEAMKRNLMQTGCIIDQVNEDMVKLRYVETSLQYLKFESFGDHRIAMACSIFSALTDIEVNNEEVVSKSFPNFWSVLIQSTID